MNTVRDEWRALWSSNNATEMHLLHQTSELLSSMGKHEEALVQYQKALEVFLTVYGQEHPSVAMSYGNMGYVYRSLGKAEEAREMFTKTYSIFLKVLGPDHPHTQQAKSGVD